MYVRQGSKLSRSSRYHCKWELSKVSLDCGASPGTAGACRIPGELLENSSWDHLSFPMSSFAKGARSGRKVAIVERTFESSSKEHVSVFSPGAS